MRSQIKVEGESLSANITFVWLFACVHELMPLKLGIVKEFFVASWYRAHEMSLPVSHLMLSI